MKEKLKRAIAIFLLMVEMLVPTSNISANEVTHKVTFLDAYLIFDVWQGNGNSSVSIGDDFLTKNRNLVKFDEFEELQCDKDLFSTSNYSTTELNGNTIITLDEKYLKTLKDGVYYYKAIFAKAIIPLRLYVVTHKVSLADAYFQFPTWTGKGTAQVELTENTFSYAFYPELFKKLEYKGKTVGNSNYTISKFQNSTVIILNEEYLKTLSEGIHYFTADFMNVRIQLRLNKKTAMNIEKSKKPTTIKKVKVLSKKKKLVVTWKKKKNVTGYIIKIGTNKKITKNKKTITIKKNRNKVTIKGLKNNKKYYVKVRAYNIINGKKYFGLWSTRKVKKTK